MRSKYYNSHAEDQDWIRKVAPGFAARGEKPQAAIDLEADGIELEALACAILNILAKAKAKPKAQNFAQRPAARPPQCPAGEVRTCVPSIRPSVFDPERDMMLAELFERRAFVDRFQPGDAAEIYFGASAGSRRISKYFGAPTYKLGSVSHGNLIQRFAQHNAESLASCWDCDGEIIKDQDFQWFPSYIPSVAPISPNSPIRANARTIVVSLPDTLTPLGFEKEFRKKLRHCSLAEWLETPAARAHCQAVGADPAVGRRLTPYAYGVATQMSVCEELYTLTPKTAARSIIAISETIILEHLELL